MSNNVSIVIEAFSKQVMEQLSSALVARDKPPDRIKGWLGDGDTMKTMLAGAVIFDKDKDTAYRIPTHGFVRKDADGTKIKVLPWVGDTASFKSVEWITEHMEGATAILNVFGGKTSGAANNRPGLSLRQDDTTFHVERTEPDLIVVLTAPDREPVRIHLSDLIEQAKPKILERDDIQPPTIDRPAIEDIYAARCTDFFDFSAMDDEVAEQIKTVMLRSVGRDEDEHINLGEMACFISGITQNFDAHPGILVTEVERRTVPRPNPTSLAKLISTFYDEIEKLGEPADNGAGVGARGQQSFWQRAAVMAKRRLDGYPPNIARGMADVGSQLAQALRELGYKPDPTLTGGGGAWQSRALRPSPARRSPPACGCGR